MIYQKITDIMSEIVNIGKIKREDIVPTLLPLLSKYKISIKPLAVTDYIYKEQESSFIATYELIDVEDENLGSVLVQVPARWI